MKLIKLIRKLELATTVSILSGDYDKLLYELKCRCRKDESILMETARCLKHDSTNEKVSTRLNALYLLNILFNRSKLFRDIICDSNFLCTDHRGSTTSRNTYLQDLMMSLDLAITIPSDPITGSHDANEKETP